MESVNELVDNHTFNEATKKLKAIEDQLNFTLKQDLAEQVPANFTEVSHLRSRNLRELLGAIFRLSDSGFSLYPTWLYNLIASLVRNFTSASKC